MMREGKIILPHHDNDGLPAPIAHAWLEKRLIEEFGGLTKTEGKGAWKHNGHTRYEFVTIYTVAGEFRTLLPIVRELLECSDQHAIYWVNFDGEVFITYR